MKCAFKLATCALFLALVTAAYAACWVESGNNCVWAGKTQIWSIQCGQSWYGITITANTTPASGPGDYAVSPQTPGTYHNRQWNYNCYTWWDWVDCGGQPRNDLWANTGYYRVTWSYNCAYP